MMSDFDYKSEVPLIGYLRHLTSDDELLCSHPDSVSSNAIAQVQKEAIRIIPKSSFKNIKI